MGLKKWVSSSLVFVQLSTSVCATPFSVMDSAYPNPVSERPSITTAAGQFLYATNPNGEPVVLLGKRSVGDGVGTWCTPGGLADPQDKTLAQAAAREVSEETFGIYAYPDGLLRNTSSHTFHFQNEFGRETLYRMYMRPVTFVPSEFFNEKLKSATGCSQEYFEFAWVPVKDLGSYDLFAPFKAMLDQQPVSTYLEKIQKIDLPSVLYPIACHKYSTDGQVAPLHLLIERNNLLNEDAQQRKEDLTLCNGIAAKAALNLQIKMHKIIQENKDSLEPSEMKKHPYTRTDFLKTLRDYENKNASPSEPFTLTMMRYELKDKYLEVITEQGLDEHALKMSIARTMLKSEEEKEYSVEIYEVLKSMIKNEFNAPEIWFETLVHGVKTELQNPGWQAAYHGTNQTMANLFKIFTSIHEMVRIDPTSSYASLRGVDLYTNQFVSDLTTQGWEKHIAIAFQAKAAQYFCANLWLSLTHSFTTNSTKLYIENSTVYGQFNFSDLLRQEMESLGMNCDTASLNACYQQHEKKTGTLLQVLTSRPHLDEVWYRLSAAGGPVSTMLDQSIQTIKKNQKPDLVQVRLTPHSPQTINPFHIQIMDLEDKESDQELHVIILNQIAEWLHQRTQLTPGALYPYGLEGRPELPPLQQLAKYVVEGEAYKNNIIEKYDLTPYEQALPSLLQYNQWDSVINYLSIFPAIKKNSEKIDTIFFHAFFRMNLSDLTLFSEKLYEGQNHTLPDDKLVRAALLSHTLEDPENIIWLIKKFSPKKALPLKIASMCHLTRYSYQKAILTEDFFPSCPHEREEMLHNSVWDIVSIGAPPDSDKKLVAVFLQKCIEDDRLSSEIREKGKHNFWGGYRYTSFCLDPAQKTHLDELKNEFSKKKSYWAHYLNLYKDLPSCSPCQISEKLDGFAKEVSNNFYPDAAGNFEYMLNTLIKEKDQIYYDPLVKAFAPYIHAYYSDRPHNLGFLYFLKNSEFSSKFLTSYPRLETECQWYGLSLKDLLKGKQIMTFQ